MILGAGTLLAQRSFTVSGTLIDSDSKEPLVFATIGVKNESISTVTNSLGKFDFHIPAEYKDNLMVISMMGYENREVPIRDLINKDTILFQLNKATKVLEEVVIKDSLTGADITQIAVNRIEDNFPMEPFLLEGFYRDLKKLGGTYFSLLEAAVKIYDEDYGYPKNKDRLRERVGLTEVRKSLGYDNKWVRYFEQNNLLESLLLENDVRYHDFPDIDPEKVNPFYQDFKRIKITYYNEHRVYVVERNTPNRFTRMYIDTETYAIIRIEQEELFPNTLIKKRKRMVSKQISEKKIIDFKEYRGKMYLNYMTMESKINWYNEKTESLKFETEVLQELLVNQVYANTVERIDNTEKMRRYGLQYQETRYNKEFWANYNVIKDTPLNEEIVSDLEKQGVLEFQFEDR
ncbi:carboxypeptidase-like regulatory domain-containing protein [Fulvivirga sedimenti]|uniref:Carboxypeptidase-like regulatory domain-containing protein n=1 Tax=Fulvivirga sedimenti TaxID=2879465 RepID=A0A9X1HNU5_9BACT|nr:carboxypeptidase-like regulatory domain-containing protein [Fulvivirga sedimenti]MCA6074243.1 carboxypeptidase-like regulatory domain-containing protein [Fulvivirga sedimenti]